MTCDELRPELIPYHFGEVPAETRDRLETHLPGCPACVTELLSLKRAIETADETARPSDLARARLRAAVASAVGAAPRRRWERPLAFAVAASAVFAAVLAMRTITSGPGAPPLGAPMSEANPRGGDPTSSARGAGQRPAE
jgi:anti-sigma factor RsiW